MILTIRKYYHITWAVNNGSVLNLLLNLNKEIIDGGIDMRGEYWSQSIELWSKFSEFWKVHVWPTAFYSPL